MDLALPHIANIIQTSQFIYEKCNKKNSWETWKQLWKTNSLNFASTYSEPFLLFQRKFPQYLDVRNAKKSLLEQLIIDNNSLACETILSSCGGNVFKRTLMPIFVKGYHVTWSIFGVWFGTSFLLQYWLKPSQLHSNGPLGKEVRRKDWPGNN